MSMKHWHVRAMSDYFVLDDLVVTVYVIVGQRNDATIPDTPCHHWCQVRHFPGMYNAYLSYESHT